MKLKTGDWRVFRKDPEEFLKKERLVDVIESLDARIVLLVERVENLEDELLRRGRG